jgi:hypothetical protein
VAELLGERPQCLTPLSARSEPAWARRLSSGLAILEPPFKCRKRQIGRRWEPTGPLGQEPGNLAGHPNDIPMRGADAAGLQSGGSALERRCAAGLVGTWPI